MNSWPPPVVTAAVMMITSSNLHMVMVPALSLPLPSWASAEGLTGMQYTVYLESGREREREREREEEREGDRGREMERDR